MFWDLLLNWKLIALGLVCLAVLGLVSPRLRKIVALVGGAALWAWIARGRKARKDRKDRIQKIKDTVLKEEQYAEQMDDEELADRLTRDKSKRMWE